MYESSNPSVSSIVMKCVKVTKEGPDEESVQDILLDMISFFIYLLVSCILFHFLWNEYLLTSTTIVQKINHEQALGLVFLFSLFL